jgi:hypothetical protein
MKKESRGLLELLVFNHAMGKVQKLRSSLEREGAFYVTSRRSFHTDR